MRLPTLLAPILLGSLITLATMATLALFARAAARHERRRRRERELLLQSRFESFLMGRGGEKALRRAAARATSGGFWGAIETLGLEWRGPAWPALTRALERTPHCAAERRALRDDSPLRRELAARRLGLLRSAASRRELRRALVRGPEMVTFSAALSLARYRDARALRWVLAHPDAFARRTPRARTTLLRAFGRGAKPELLRALETGEPSSLEHALVETLGIGGYRPAIPAIARRLTHHELDVRVSAARSLGRLEAREASRALVAALDDDAWQVRTQAAWALGRVGATDAIEALTESLSDRTWWVRHHAAYALGELGPEGRAALVRASRDAKDPYARDIADEVLGGGFDHPAANA